MFKLSFTLKQHTPLIHFQHNQEGATLRATEVKPKLDRYLLSMVFEHDFENIKQFLTGFSKDNESEIRKKFEKGFSAIDYKIIINPTEVPIEFQQIPAKFPCFFGNIGEENNQNLKIFSIAKKPMEIIFISYHKKIIDYLAVEVPNFFARNNFGSRQSKGFGSFYIDENDARYELPGLYSFFISSYQNNNYKTLFKEIDMIHKVFRSGINDIGENKVNLFYMKPLIWKYFRDKNINWDKKKIKEEFYNVYMKNQISKYDQNLSIEEAPNWPLHYDGTEYKMVKDMLGLSSVENWREPYKDSITKKSSTIDRMKSPLFYKPIKVENEFRVYVDFSQVPVQFFNAPFEISNGVKNFMLHTPEEFHMEEFIYWCLKEAAIDELISPEFADSPKADRIINIFDQLRNNIIN